MVGSRPANEHPDSAALGFLNPWLYGDEVRIHKGLNDIVEGSNPGCETIGFEAREGWDPVRATTHVSLNFRHWLIWWAIGDGSRNTKLSKPAVPH